MLKKNYMLSLLLLASLVSAPVFSVYSAPAEHTADTEKKEIELEKKEKHEHTKGDTCPLKKKSPQSCPIARKKVQDKLKPKKTGWDKWFGKDEGKGKDGKKLEQKEHHTARPSKSWWKFWGTETSTGGTHDSKIRARQKQEHRSELKRSGKSFDKKKFTKKGSKKGGKRGSKRDKKRVSRRRGKKDDKKKGAKKHNKKKNGKKRSNKRDKKRRKKQEKKKNKSKQDDDSKKAIIEVK